MGRVHLKDMDRIKSISNLNISPCGDVLAFCLECTCIPENRYKTYLYSYELKSGNIRRISCSDQIQSYCFDQNGMLIYTYGKRKLWYQVQSSGRRILWQGRSRERLHCHWTMRRLVSFQMTDS